MDDDKSGVLGPGILARTMSVATVRGKESRAWQYHSRSDAHSKVACWTLLFDLLVRCDAMREATAKCKLGFAINRTMVGPINKTLDLVVTWKSRRERAAGRTFADLVRTYGIVLDPYEQATLDALPALVEDRRNDTSEVAVAIEAKACMTEHIKSLPRLHAEILATGYLARLAVRDCITVSYNLVNAAPLFVSPSAVGKRNRHVQPSDARRVVEMLATAIPLTRSTDYGYDAIGTTVVDCRNDGSPVVVVEDDAIGPSRSAFTHYERMVSAVCSRFRARFGGS